MPGWNSMINQAPQRQAMTKSPMAMGRAPGLAGPGAGQPSNGFNQMAMKQRVAGGGQSPMPPRGVGPAMPGRPMAPGGAPPMARNPQADAANAMRMKQKMAQAQAAGGPAPGPGVGDPRAVMAKMGGMG